MPWQAQDLTMAMEVSLFPDYDVCHYFPTMLFIIIYCSSPHQTTIIEIGKHSHLQCLAPEPVYEEPETGYGPPDDG